MIDNADRASYIVPGDDLFAPDELKSFWRVRCPACDKIHERIVHRHWDDEKKGVVESHQVICMETKTTFFIKAYAPFNILRETHFGLVKDGKPSDDGSIPF